MTEGAPAVGPTDPTDHEDEFRRESALHHWLVSGALVLVVGPVLVVAGAVIAVADDASDGLRLLGGVVVLVGLWTYRGERPATVHLLGEGWKWQRVYTTTPARADDQRRRVLHDEAVEVPTEWEGALELPADAEPSVDGIPGDRWLVEARRSPRPFARRTVVPIVVDGSGPER